LTVKSKWATVSEGFLIILIKPIFISPFLEPTSGLDATTALSVMIKLKEIAESGRTVICSVHQPRSDVFALFDHLVLLVKGGRVAYSGSASEVCSYFGKLGHSIPDLANPAEYALEMVSIDARNAEVEETSDKRVGDLVHNWKIKSSPVADQPDVAVEAVSTLPLQIHKKQRSSLWNFNVLTTLVSRSFFNISRQPVQISRLFLLQTTGIALILLFSRLQSSPLYVQARIGIVQQVVSVLFMGTVNNIVIFPQEYRTFKFEKLEKLYGCLAFIISYSINEIPLEILSSLIFVASVYGSVGMQLSVQTFLMSVAAIFCSVNIGESIGMMALLLFNNPESIIQITPSIFSIMAMLSGLMSVGASIPVFLDRLNYISPIRYAARILTINEFGGGITFDCSSDEVCPFPNGVEVLKAYSFNPQDLWLDFGILIALTVAYRLLALIFLKFKSRK
jgi:hypothetical protein